MNFYKASKKAGKKHTERSLGGGSQEGLIIISSAHVAAELVLSCGLAALRCDCFQIFGGGKCKKVRGTDSQRDENAPLQPWRLPGPTFLLPFWGGSPQEEQELEGEPLGSSEVSDSWGHRRRASAP